MVRYITHAEKFSLLNLRYEWQRLLKRDGLHISYMPKKEREFKNIIFYIDESFFECRGKKILAIGLSLIVGIDNKELEDITKEILREHLVNPFSGGRKKNLEKNGLHYADANEKLRSQYIDELASFPVNGYIAYGELTLHEKYEELYLHLLERLLTHRLVGCDGALVKLIFEENSQIPGRKIEDLIKNVYRSLLSCF